MKPTLFVASSSESNRLALGVQANLQHIADATTWDQGVFSPGTITLDVLSEKALVFDFGVFVFSADDLVQFRKQEYTAVRDNVLFEFGLFISRLGRRRVFMLVPDKSPTPLHLPTDLAGLSAATYDSARLEREPNVRAVLGPACLAIETAIVSEWREPSDLTGDLVLLLRYLCRDAGNWIPPDLYARGIAIFNGAPEQADQHVGRGWRRAVRYQLLCLYLEGLAERNDVTSVLYRISNKGKRVLELLRTQPGYATIFQAELYPLTGVEWGRGLRAIEPPKPQLSGDDYRLLFAVYAHPGTFISSYESAIEEPARSSLLERAQRLERMGFLSVIVDSNELDITSKGRDVVGSIKSIADQVYRSNQK
jgi:Predicted nucleotide-binding protein containing TIR-like domain